MEPIGLPPGTLVLTTDLPFFPGKMGCDFFNLRHLAESHAVGVVGPLHEIFSPEGVRNLESFLTGSYFWPRPAPETVLPPLRALPEGRLKPWVRRQSAERLRHWLLRLLGLNGQPTDAYVQVATLTNCAPQLLAALAARPWQTLVLIQTNTAPWLDYLPAHLAKLVYFHDVRSDSLRRGAEHEPDRAVAERQMRLIPAVAGQEARVCREADIVGFVSDLDERRAQTAYAPAAATGVAPLPVDTDYFHPAAADWQRDARSIVLFTGHLGHPPNVDAVLYFLDSIWPGVRARVPGAVFQAVGCLPAERSVAGGGDLAGEGFELHADVPDIRPYFWNASAYVVPMRFGGGVRQKIFETWSMQVPLVCTTMAVEGTHAAHGVNCWQEDAPDAFAARVAGLLSGTEAARPEVVAKATETALAFNSIPAAATRFEQLVERAAHIRRQRPYRMLIDLRWMEIGRAGGVEQMAYELVSAISRIDHRNEYRILCPRSTFHEWEFPAGFRCRGFFTDKNEARAEALRAGVANGLSGELRMQPVLTPPMRALRAYRKMDFDLVHSVCSYTFPDLGSFPAVLSVHDLQHVHYPEFFTPEEFKERDDLYRTSCAAARHIICISEFTRQDLHRCYGVPLEKMTTIWNIPSRSAWLKVDAARSRELAQRDGNHRAVLLLSRARLAAQEPRAAHCRLRHDRQGPARRRAARVHRAAVSGGRSGATGHRRTPPRKTRRPSRLPFADGNARALPGGVGAGVPVAFRGLRDARGRGDDRGLPHRVREHDEPARDRRGRGGDLRSAEHQRDGGGDAAAGARGRPARRSRRGGPAALPPVFRPDARDQDPRRLPAGV